MLTGGRGDDGYVAIIKEQYPAMYSYGMHFVNNESLVKDCIQDVFVSLWNNREKTDAIETRSIYLMLIISDLSIRNIFYKIRTWSRTLVGTTGHSTP